MADVIARVVRIPIGDERIAMPVLSIAESEVWLTKFDTAFVGLLSAATAEGNDIDAAYGFVSLHPENFVDLIVTYDVTGVLPARDELVTRMTKTDLLVACLEVWRAENPLVELGLMAWLSAKPETHSFEPMNWPQPNGAGDQLGSGPN